MDYRKIIKEIGRGKNHARDLDRDTARGLYAHMLNGEVPDLELGGVLIALRIKGEGEAEMLGFYEAMQNHTIKLTPPAGKPMPIVIPSYNGARKQANLRRCWRFSCTNSVFLWWFTGLAKIQPAC